MNETLEILIFENYYKFNFKYSAVIRNKSVCLHIILLITHLFLFDGILLNFVLIVVGTLLLLLISFDQPIHYFNVYNNYMMTLYCMAFTL